jgi:predicted transcriptional regulator
MGLIDDTLNLEKRRAIYNFILDNPGIHQREISQKMNIPRTTLKYHLSFLKKCGLIALVDEKNFSRYFVLDEVKKKDRQWFKLIRQDTRRKMLLIFILFYGVSRMDLSRELEMTPSTIDFHLKKLLKAGVIEPAKLNDEGIIFDMKWEEPNIIKRRLVGNEVIYKLTDRYVIYRFFIKFKDSLINDDVSKSVLYCIKLVRNLRSDEKLNSYRDFFDSVADHYYKMCPIPFCA